MDAHQKDPAIGVVNRDREEAGLIERRYRIVRNETASLREYTELRPGLQTLDRGFTLGISQQYLIR